MEKQLIGTWKIDPTDKIALKVYGEVSMEFRENGELIYTIYEGDKTNVILLTYKVNGDLLVTNQPSHPREDSSNFEILPDGRLKLISDGFGSTYVLMEDGQ